MKAGTTHILLVFSIVALGLMLVNSIFSQEKYEAKPVALAYFGQAQESDTAQLNAEQEVEDTAVQEAQPPPTRFQEGQ
ncbi:hypothetical protein OKW21_003404 [Catalinimonas alkaloidigena]|uniref:hypothetical protein n=1 Tax=Catalinimonas alkaloidigena TaxID=1075417 RepID=UPI0024050BE5|nr:hypothetical protein [Catalinimonas alkaloidigena]MDF9798141.1 hypothetical protein [Catalinimonas alkaloidigena]